jgi:hypothetical protein
MQCPCCENEKSISVFNAENQPLARYGLCETLDESKGVEGHSLSIMECTNCGVLFNDQFSYEAINYRSVKVQESRVFSPRIHNYMLDKVKELKNKVDLKNKTIMEIGCGEGFFINGFEDSIKLGYEPSTEGEQAEKLGIKVTRDYFNPEKDSHDEEPKLIILRQVLEHLKNPQTFIKSFAKILKKNEDKGYLYIEVPNSNPTKNIGRAYDFYFEHYLYFTTASLVLFVEQAGFTIEYCREEFDGEILSMLCSIGKNQKKENTFNDKIEKIKALVAERKRNGKTIAAWGSAGTGTSLLNLCKFGVETIECVIDSDVRKQNKYIPGTGQLVVGSEHFETTPPDVIIILTQFHKLDIMEQIKNTYGEHIEVVIPDEL